MWTERLICRNHWRYCGKGRLLLWLMFISSFWFLCSASNWSVGTYLLKPGIPCTDGLVLMSVSFGSTKPTKISNMAMKTPGSYSTGPNRLCNVQAEHSWKAEFKIFSLALNMKKLFEYTAWVSRAGHLAANRYRNSRIVQVRILGLQSWAPENQS